MKRSLGLILLILLSSTSFALEMIVLEEGYQAMPFDHQKVVYIRKGDEIHYADPDIDVGEWTLISLPSKWEKAAFPDWKGICWYRIHIVFPENLPQKSLGIQLGEIFDVDETYFNGKLIGKTGSFGKPGKRKNAFEIDRLYEIPTVMIRPGKTNVIAFKVQGIFGASGPQKGNFVIGGYADIQRNMFLKQFVKILPVMLYLILGLYFLLFFTRRPSDLEKLIFGFFLLLLSIYSFSRTELRFFYFDDFNLLKQIEMFSLFMMFPLFTAFIYTYFREKHSILSLIYFIYATVTAFTVLLIHDPVLRFRLNMFFVQPSWLICVILAVIVLIRNVKKNMDARLMLAAFLLFLITATADILSSRNLLDLPSISPFGFILFVISIALILANQFVTLHQEVEDLNRHLELKVEDRTREIKNLMEQQYGDYYLTSLLINPLVTNEVNSLYVGVDFYISQKKKFSFRKWDAEIGGDICIAHQIELEGKKYIAFVNGDAMGKSIQGAGGALVFGVIFNAVIVRTHMLENYQNLKPEEWLYETYNELQTLFESFDGSMLVSCIMGLLEEETGILNYFNTEHPRMVLYRDNKAVFADDDEAIGRKIGVMLTRGIKIQKMQLKPKDLLIAGSDGRDDLLLETKEDGTRIINEDETLFLQAVEKGGGNLEKIAESVLNFGQLTDDFTLLSIRFRGARRKMKPAEGDELDTVKKELLQKYNSARQLYQKGNYSQSVEILETIKNMFRQEDHNFNLYSLLGYAYFQMKKYERAELYWNKARQIIPDDEKINENLKNVKKYIR